MAAYTLWATVLLAGFAVCSSALLDLEDSPEKVRNQMDEIHSLKHVELSLFAPLSLASDHAKLPDMNYTRTENRKQKETPMLKPSGTTGATGPIRLNLKQQNQIP